MAMSPEDLRSVMGPVQAANTPPPMPATASPPGIPASALNPGAPPAPSLPTGTPGPISQATAAQPVPGQTATRLDPSGARSSVFSQAGAPTGQPMGPEVNPTLQNRVSQIASEPITTNPNARAALEQTSRAPDAATRARVAGSEFRASAGPAPRPYPNFTMPEAPPAGAEPRVPTGINPGAPASPAPAAPAAGPIQRAGGALRTAAQTAGGVAKAFGTVAGIGNVIRGWDMAGNGEQLPTQIEGAGRAIVGALPMIPGMQAPGVAANLALQAADTTGLTGAARKAVANWLGYTVDETGKFQKPGAAAPQAAAPAAPASAPPAAPAAPAPAAPAAPQGNVPLGIRNNNPGNLRNADGSFMQFRTPEEGLQALHNNLIAYGTKHGINTVEGVISRWAPPTENNTAAYIKFVQQATGLQPGQQINLQDPATRDLLAAAITRFENGRGGTPTRYDINGSVPPPAAAPAAPTQRAAPIQQAVARAAAGGAPGDIAVLSGGPLNGGIDAYHERYDPASGVYQKVDPLGPITDVSRLSLIQRAVDAARTGQSQQAAQLQQILAPTISGEAQTNSAGIHATGNLLSTQEQGQTARDVEGQRGASAKEVARIGADANRFTPTQDTETTDPLTGRTTRQTSAGVFDRQNGTVTRPEKAKQPIGKAQWEAHVKKYKLTPEQQASYLRENNFVVQ